MAPANCGCFSNKYVAEILTGGISNALFMFVCPDSIRHSSGLREGKHIIGIEEFIASTIFFAPTQQEWRGRSHNGYQIEKEDFSLHI
jgi:hypothetical protein